MKILVATGGAAHSGKAVRMSRLVARATGAALTILVVSKEAGAGLTAAEKIAEAARTSLGAMPAPVETKVRVGHPAEQILQEAEAGDYNLVIVGEKERHHLVTRFLLGSTAERVVEHAPCPVLIAKGEVKPIRRILLCDSGAADPPLLTRLMAQLGDFIEGQEDITILHVMSQMSAGPGVRGAVLRADAESLIEAESPEGALLERDVELLEERHAHAEPLVRHGAVVEEIVDEADCGRYDLLVIGGRRTEGWQRLLLDDLAHKILTQVALPVLVVR